MGSRWRANQILMMAELFPEFVGKEPPMGMTQAQKDFVKQLQQHRGNDGE